RGREDGRRAGRRGHRGLRPVRAMTGSRTAARALQPLIEGLLGLDLPVQFRFWDGSSLGPDDAAAAVVVRSPRALRRLVTAPGELGLGRAYVAGDIDLDGDLDEVLALGDRRPDLRLGAAQWSHAVRALASSGALRPGRVRPPPEEARLRGRRHTRAQDA